MARVSSLWKNMSARERQLAMAVGVLVALMLCLVIAQRAMGRLRDLDRTIDRLEEELRLNRMAEARAASVEAKFAEVVAQHSSSWSENEIHNRLRTEIYRLAQEDPTKPSSEAKNLVEIPRLRQGTLNETGEGYREYQLSINIPFTDVYSIILFLVRLQASPQSLRIDGLELSRAPNSEMVMANVLVTRTVVDGVPANEAAVGGAVAADEGAASTDGQRAEAAADAGPEVTWDGSSAEGWEAQGCEISVSAQAGKQAADGGSCLSVRATEAESFVAFVRDLDAGSSYALTIEAVSTGAAWLRVANHADGSLFEGEQELTADGDVYRYELTFSVPEGSSGTTAIQAPRVVLGGADVQVFLDNLVLRKVSESAQ